MTRKPTCTLYMGHINPHTASIAHVTNFSVELPPHHELKRRTTPEGIVFSVVKKEGK